MGWLYFVSVEKLFQTKFLLVSFSDLGSFLRWFNEGQMDQKTSTEPGMNIVEVSVIKATSFGWVSFNWNSCIIFCNLLIAYPWQEEIIALKDQTKFSMGRLIFAVKRELSAYPVVINELQPSNNM